MDDRCHRDFSVNCEEDAQKLLEFVNFNVNTLTGGTITSTRTSATNLYGNDFITPNYFKVSDNFSAMTAYFSGAGDTNKSLCLNGSANNLTAKNDFKIQQNLTINYLSATEKAIATAVQNTEGILNNSYLSLSQFLLMFIAAVALGYKNVELRKDINDNPRMIKATL